MRSLLVGISILLLLATIFMFWWKSSASGYGRGESTESFDINRGFLQVALKLSDENVGRRINEAAGCRFVQSTLIKKEKNGRVRHIVYQHIMEMDIAGSKRYIKVRDESTANIREGWIENVSYQIDQDEVVRNQVTRTRFTRVGVGVTHVEMWSSVEIKGIPSLFIQQGVESGMGASRTEMIRQLE